VLSPFAKEPIYKLRGSCLAKSDSIASRRNHARRRVAQEEIHLMDAVALRRTVCATLCGSRGAFRVQGSGFWVLCSGFRVQGLGCVCWRCAVQRAVALAPAVPPLAAGTVQQRTWGGTADGHKGGPEKSQPKPKTLNPKSIWEEPQMDTGGPEQPHGSDAGERVDPDRQRPACEERLSRQSWHPLKSTRNSGVTQYLS